jgi:transglutaminase-like putative cysteine protease
MVPEMSRVIRRATFALLVLASAATEVAAADARPVWQSLGLAAVWVALAAALGRLVPAPKDPSRVPPRFVLFLLLGLAAAPFVVEPLRRDWTGEGYPLELQMVFALRNVGLGLAACSAWVLCLRLASVVSLFLMLFAVAMTDHVAVLILLGLYSATGSVWLMLAHWTGLRRFFVASDTMVALEVQPGRERPPWLAVLVTVALVGTTLGLVALGPQRAAQALGEWLPTSGGTGGYDPFARGGINDGDDEVKGENAHSTGMTQSDTFLDSPLPSLYDLFNDKYGEPFKPKERERSIALDNQNTKTNESKKPPADNLRPNREFALSRKGPRRPRDGADRAARALFEVQGRTPLHVRVAAFDTFDGSIWQEALLTRHIALIEKEPNSCWMKVQGLPPAAFLAGIEAHQFKITGPTGSLVPTPPLLARFRVGRVDQVDFFAWSQERILRLAQRKTPAGIAVETQCRTIDPRALRLAEFPRRFGSNQGPRFTLPKTLSPEVAALAEDWAGDLPPGWPQIEAVVQHLRTGYALDISEPAPVDCLDPLGHFLLQSGRGPDYQFASAAAVLLRVLGYPTRLVSGFYVSPNRYDPLTRHTPVVQEDLHFWAEVQLPSGDWLVLEPTPGYEVLGPAPPWSERAWAALVATAAWAWRHAVELSLGAGAAAGLWWWRRELLDAAVVAGWLWFPGRTWQQCIRRALLVLEWRGRWVGRPRRPSQTVPSWLQAALPAPIRCPADLPRLTRMAEWAAYAPSLSPPWPPAEVKNVCACALRAWTLRRWRRAVAGGVFNGARR